MDLSTAIHVVNNMNLDDLCHGRASNPVRRNEIDAIEKLLAIGVSFKNFVEAIADNIEE